MSELPRLRSQVQATASCMRGGRFTTREALYIFDTLLLTLDPKEIKEFTAIIREHYIEPTTTI